LQATEQTQKLNDGKAIGRCHQSSREENMAKHLVFTLFLLFFSYTPLYYYAPFSIARVSPGFEAYGHLSVALTYFCSNYKAWDMVSDFCSPFVLWAGISYSGEFELASGIRHPGRYNYSGPEANLSPKV
jgi:hypothetical protein